MNDDREWEVGWEGHERAQIRRMARLSLIEKLQWLEEAHRLVRHMRRPDPGTRTPLDEPDGREAHEPRRDVPPGG